MGLSINRDKVIKGLECLISNEVPCEGCPYMGSGYCLRNIANDAMELLKEQEAREPHYTTMKYLVCGTEVTINHPECPRCIENGLRLWDAEIEKGQAFCKRCGQEVKWE